ncbi:MAG: N-acetylmuramoyl-L-alanine amidase [uncultured Chloroflexi bacterium]|uniref:N-acetylmuramoyl-L-alanine amidase n=1 Tax=uncultured Chloroflexota bacterium TaxID=166587 RepID=A0A6J4IH68_9CHLR|nr:MAG: N-acetylmuramoyl-L-alanine amidase [uncultured Chloroflexota bacterium]
MRGGNQRAHGGPLLSRLHAVPRLALFAAIVLALLPAPAHAGGRNAPRGAPVPQAQQAALAGRVIVLDPGHGGPDPGAVRREGETTEKFVNLEVAQRLRQLLAAAGARVIMTREQDTRPVAPGAAAPPGNEREDLEARVQIANAANADLFISLHADVLPNPEKGGAAVFWGPRTGYTYPGERPEELVQRSRELSHAVLWHLVAKTGVVERGAEPANFYVLGSTRMPSILVEMATLTNLAEAVFLTGEGFQRRIAEGIFNGIADYYEARHNAAVVADVTLPDGSIVPPGARLTKVWRLKNTSRVAIGPGYRFGCYAGDQLDVPAEVPLTQVVPPGGEFEISVPLHTPQGDRGWLFSQWRLRTPGGVWFGPPIWTLLMSRGPRPVDPVPALPAAAGAAYFPETGHNVSAAFRRFFEANGGIRLFGYPRTEELVEDGRTVQYFQRARLEWWPEAAGTPDEVRLTPLAEQLLGAQLPLAGVPLGEAGSGGAGDDALVLPDPLQPGVGHAVRGAFRRLYESVDGPRLFGLPLSEEVPWLEPGLPPERAYPVQTFQRVRLEYRLASGGESADDSGDPWSGVQVSLLGDEALRRRGLLDPPSPIGRIG